MAGYGVIEVQEYRNGHSGSDTTIVEQYIVTTTDPEVTCYEVCRPAHVDRDTSLPDIVGTPLPKVNDTHVDTKTFRVLPGGIVANRIEGKATQWIVSVTYTQSAMLLDNISNFKIGKRVSNVVSEGAYEVFRETGEETAFRNENRPIIPFKNSAGEMYDPVDTQTSEYSTIIQFVLQQEFDESENFNYVDAIDYQGTVNKTKTSVLGFPLEPHQGLMLTVAPELRVDGDGNLRWYTFYEIEMKGKGERHWLRLQNQGFYAKPVGSNNAREITEKDVNPTDGKADKYVTKPQLLDSDGRLLGDSDDVVFWEFRLQREKDWKTGLGIPEDAIDLGGYLDD